MILLNFSDSNMPADTEIAVPTSSPRTTADLDLHPAVQRFAAAARAKFGDRLDRIVLYGSRAHGDHRPDSDYDIAIFVRDRVNAYTEYADLAGIAGWALADDDVEINAWLHRAEAWPSSTLPILRAIRRDGITL
jgi:uncharacterized protein